MNKLLVAYADGSTESVTSDLSAEAYFDSRFAGLPKDILEKCAVTEHAEKSDDKAEKAAPKAKK